MTIDEAIKHCEEKEREQALNGCFACAEDHKQLAEWLKDYKRLLEERPQGEWITTRTMIHDGNPYCSICDEENIIRSNFCPNCGLPMKKGGAE